MCKTKKLQKSNFWYEVNMCIMNASEKKRKTKVQPKKVCSWGRVGGDQKMCELHAGLSKEAKQQALLLHFIKKSNHWRTLWKQDRFSRTCSYKIGIWCNTQKHAWWYFIHILNKNFLRVWKFQWTVEFIQQRARYPVFVSIATQCVRVLRVAGYFGNTSKFLCSCENQNRMQQFYSYRRWMGVVRTPAEAHRSPGSRWKVGQHARAVPNSHYWSFY